MPSRLRPTAPIAADAVLVGDPGRALMLAQELLEEPKMCNHARGLWGYSGRTPGGAELTIQSTGMGGPSAAIVLTDLAELGVRRAVRIGTCTALDPKVALGDLLAVSEARHVSGGPESFGGGAGESVLPDTELAERLERELAPAGVKAKVVSFDVIRPADPETSMDAIAADLQTATVLACCRSLQIPATAVLIVTETTTGERIGDAELERTAKRAGRAVAQVLSG